MPTVKIGALLQPQNTDWSSFLAAAKRAEELGYDSVWTWDHLYPIVGDWRGSIFEGWLTITAWAQATSRIQVGLFVGANTFRNPALVAKMATTLDHISAGRTILGIGAAWFAREHRAFGLEFGDGPPDRLRWLGEALPVMRGMLDGTEPSSKGPHYAIRDVRNEPRPVQAHLPIMVGGSGERVTLRLVARYADMNNIGGSVEFCRQKDRTLVAHCEAVGRDEREIERTLGADVMVIRDSRAEAEQVLRRQQEHNRTPAGVGDEVIGSPEEVAEQLAPYLDIGYRYIIPDFMTPLDDESMARFAGQVKPLLERG